MNDKPSRQDNSDLYSDIDLSVEINPDMYLSDDNPNRHDRFEALHAAEDVTEAADRVAAKESGKSKGFVTAKADG